MYRAEYIWIDGAEDPYPGLRSKTKVLEDGKEPGIWGYDGSSTNQAPGENSDVVLKPQFSCPDPCVEATTSSSCVTRTHLTTCHRYQPTPVSQQ